MKRLFRNSNPTLIYVILNFMKSLMSELRFDGKVAIITGAGNGIGKVYALFFASRGAKVVVNDLGGSLDGSGTSSKTADLVVDEIKSKGGEAVANYNSVTEGQKIIETAMKAYGRVDIVINNAGILRDISFLKMTDQDWNAVLNVHLNGSFSVARAAWPIMRKQGYGRVINTSSGSGLYGNFGQANYSAAKLGIHGLTMTLAKEGEKYNMRANTIAPVAASRMTETVLPPDLLEMTRPDTIVPLVAYLAHDSCEETGSIFELGGGFISKIRLQRSEGALFDIPFTAEQVAEKFEQVCDFSKENDYPDSNSEIFGKIMENADRIKANQVEKAAAAPVNTGPSLKSDAIIELASNYVASGNAKGLVPKIGATYNVQIISKKNGPIVKTYSIDLKDGIGAVSFSPLAQADATFSLTDEDFYNLCMGKLNPQKAFIQGKMKIKGSMKKATMFTPDLFPAPTPENIAKYGKSSKL